ncbi:MAG TPA: nucleoside triphosphate pyrophosphohydrolase [Fimbriimonadaceae bacterium]|nr:nucleoside triphosphate pyrophosphohydrolase [Fimbriimonadaceae bacterium]
MVRVIRLGRPPYPSELLEQLRDAGRLYHPDPAQDGFEALRRAGLDAHPVEGDLPEDSTLLLPDSTGPLEVLVQITDRLLAPGGCPWDQEQTHTSLKKYLLEEAYELFDAIDSSDQASMREELGDVLLQPLLHAAMERRDGAFDIDSVAEAISSKLISRHPHVFGDVGELDAAGVLRQWDELKSREKGGKPRSILGGVPRTMPSLQRAYEVSKRAARTGFDWPSVEAIWEKVREEEEELRAALAGGDPAAVEQEFADLLFALVNVGRWLGVEPEAALRAMVSRFTSRFEAMEAKATKPLQELSPEEWDVLWIEAKKELS